MTCKNLLPTLMCILGLISEDMKVEFAELLMEVAKKQKENAPETDDYLLEAFRTFDIERSGKISISTLKEAMINHGERLREEEINEMVAVASDARTDDENIIDYESKCNNTCCNILEILYTNNENEYLYSLTSAYHRYESSLLQEYIYHSAPMYTSCKDFLFSLFIII